jgi:dTDP-glucose 4,6-dehydratase
MRTAQTIYFTRNEMTNGIQKVLITGVGGFIFSNFVRLVCAPNVMLQEYGWTTLDSWLDVPPQNKYIGRTFKDVNQHIADITDQKTINAIFKAERPDIVIHAAAETSVDKSLNNPDIFNETNILGTKVIVDACIKWEVKKLIYISSDEVFGSLTNENEPSWTETSPINPQNPYSISKAKGEEIVLDANKNHGLIYNITRSSNNYGARQTTNKLIPRVIKCILRDQKIPIYGQGAQIRDWMYVNDHLAGIITILKCAKDNEIYNIGANSEMTNIEMVQKICTIFNKGHNLIEYITDPRGKAHDFRYSMDCSKIRALGWRPEWKLPLALAETCEWFKNNQWALDY